MADRQTDKQAINIHRKKERERERERDTNREGKRERSREINTETGDTEIERRRNIQIRHRKTQRM